MAALAERQQADRAVRVLAEQVPVGICDLDATGQLRWANGEVLRLLGHDGADSTQQLTWEHLVHPDDLPRICAALGECRVTGRQLRFRHRIQRPDGEVRWVQLHATPVVADDGAVERIVATLSDISALAETASQIQAARDAALEAVRAKSDFLARMNHEIRTPLNGVLGMTDILLDSRLSPEQLRHVEILRSAGQQLLTLLNETLDVPAVGAGHMAIERVPFDLQRLVDGVLRGHAERARREHVSFDITQDGPLPARVDGDPERIRQVLDQVIGAAVTATEGGAVQVAVSAEVLGGTSAIIRFGVQSPGVGRHDAAAFDLLAEFLQADPMATVPPDDPELALAVSRQHAQLMGGDLIVDGAEGRGTLCRFWVPVTLTAATAALGDKRGTGAAHGPGTERPRRPPRAAVSNRVLLVEDNPINQAVALALLERLGYAADAVSDGREALAALAGADYAAILMDCQMPRMDGYETTRRIRRTELEDIRTPIIALTASALRGDREKCLAAGMDDYVCKPISMDALRDVLVRWLEREDAVGPASEPAREGPEPPVLDGQTVTELADIPQLLARSAERFAVAGAGELEEMRRAVASGDLAHVKVVAHDLKGAAGTVGAVRLAAALEAFEQACDITPDRLETLLDDLDLRFSEACAALAAAGASAATEAPATGVDATR